MSAKLDGLSKFIWTKISSKRKRIPENEKRHQCCRNEGLEVEGIASGTDSAVAIEIRVMVWMEL